jgi:hypothetical protein
MGQDDALEKIAEELRRLGFSDEDMPPLLLPEDVSVEDFLKRLCDIPTWKGEDGLVELMGHLLGSRLAPWDDWPDPGDRFTVAEYVEALAKRGITEPEKMALEYATPPRQIPTWLLALLSLTSSDTGEKVAEYLAEVQTIRSEAGISAEVIDTALERFAEARRRMQEQIDATAKALRDENGPAILFRFGPDISDQAVREFLFSTIPARFWPHGAWLSKAGPEGTWACILVPKSKRAECPGVLSWLESQPGIREVRLWPVWVWTIPEKNQQT